MIPGDLSSHKMKLVLRPIEWAAVLTVYAAIRFDSWEWWAIHLGLFFCYTMIYIHEHGGLFAMADAISEKHDKIEEVQQEISETNFAEEDFDF